MRVVNCPDCGTKLKIENIDIDYGMNSIFAASVVECSNCHEMIRPHRACPKCGYYKGKDTKSKEENKTA